jgi:hypothetical protein
MALTPVLAEEAVSFCGVSQPERRSDVRQRRSEILMDS